MLVQNYNKNALGTEAIRMVYRPQFWLSIKFAVQVIVKYTSDVMQCMQYNIAFPLIIQVPTITLNLKCMT